MCQSALFASVTCTVPLSGIGLPSTTFHAPLPALAAQTRTSSNPVWLTSSKLISLADTLVAIIHIRIHLCIVQTPPLTRHPLPDAGPAFQSRPACSDRLRTRLLGAAW